MLILHLFLNTQKGGFGEGCVWKHQFSTGEIASWTHEPYVISHVTRCDVISHVTMCDVISHVTMSDLLEIKFSSNLPCRHGFVASYPGQRTWGVECVL